MVGRVGADSGGEVSVSRRLGQDFDATGCHTPLKYKGLGVAGHLLGMRSC